MCMYESAIIVVEVYSKLGEIQYILLPIEYILKDCTKNKGGYPFFDSPQ